VTVASKSEKSIRACRFNKRWRTLVRLPPGLKKPRKDSILRDARPKSRLEELGQLSVDLLLFKVARGRLAG
jgi:hypothetical protein